MIEFNRRAVEVTGEPFRLLDIGLLEGALGRPQSHWHYSKGAIGELAAYLLLGLARDHAFEQGNKRVALLAANAFLAINGYELRYPDSKLGDLIISAVDRGIGEEAFVAIFARAVRWKMVRRKPTYHRLRPERKK